VVQPPTLGQRLLRAAAPPKAESDGVGAPSAAAPPPLRDVFRASLPGADVSLVADLRDKGVPFAATAADDERFLDMIISKGLLSIDDLRKAENEEKIKLEKGQSIGLKTSGFH
jgi:hypothetical protein